MIWLVSANFVLLLLLSAVGIATYFIDRHRLVETERLVRLISAEMAHVASRLEAAVVALRENGAVARQARDMINRRDA